MVSAELIIQSRDVGKPLGSDHLISSGQGGNIQIEPNSTYNIIVLVTAVPFYLRIPPLGATVSSPVLLAPGLIPTNVRVTMGRTDSLIFDQTKTTRVDNDNFAFSATGIRNGHMTEGYAVSMLVSPQDDGTNIIFNKSWSFQIIDTSKPEYSQEQLTAIRESLTPIPQNTSLFGTTGDTDQVLGAVKSVFGVLGQIAATVGIPAIVVFAGLLFLPQIIGGLVSAVGSSIRRSFG